MQPQKTNSRPLGQVPAGPQDATVKSRSDATVSTGFSGALPGGPLVCATGSMSQQQECRRRIIFYQ